MSRSTVGSMTIVLPGLGKVIVVFPATPVSGVVTIGDMLVAVYLVIHESCIEHHGEFCEIWWRGEAKSSSITSSRVENKN